MCFHLAIDLVWIQAGRLLVIDGPIKTSLDKRLANSHNRADIYVKSVTNLLIGPGMASLAGISFKQNPRMTVGVTGRATGGDEFL